MFARRLSLFVGTFLSLAALSLAQPILLLASGVTQSNQEVIELSDSLADGKRLTRRAILVDHSPDHVWEVLADPQEMRNFIPKLETFKVIEDYPDSLKVLFEGKPVWFMKTFSCLLRVRFIQGKEITWERVSGDFERLEGSWTLEQVEDGKTLAVYSFHVKPGFFVPRFLVRSIVSKDLRKMMINVKKRINERPDQVNQDPILSIHQVSPPQ